MRILEITESLASTLVKGAAKLVPKIAPSAGRTTELFARHRTNLAQIEHLASNPRDVRALPDAIQRLKGLHSDLYDIAYLNHSNPRIVAEVNRLRDDLAPLLRNMEVNANRPGAASMLLQSIRQELVPVLTNRLRGLEALVKALDS
jgi:hypothetical protein